MKKFNFKQIFEPKITLPLIVVIASIFRLIPFLRYKYLFGYDPYFHLAYIEESLKAGEWINFYHLASAPWGVLVEHSLHPLGFYLTPYYVYKFLSIFDVSLYDAFKVTSVIFGVLTIVFFYLAMLNFYGKRKAFFSALFLSVMFGHVFRSMSNYYRGDNYMLFWYSVALFGISLTFKYGRKRWAYIFYIIPTFASGLASVFWGAYYPIFVFLLGNGIFLAIGAFILGKKKYLIHSIFLIFSCAVGAFIANEFGKYFGYGIFGWDKPQGKELTELLNLNFGWIKDIYLIIHVKYLVPLGLVMVIFAYLLINLNLIKDRKLRVMVAIGMLILGITIFFKKFDVILEAFEKIGYFKERPILETQRTTFSDLFSAYNILIFLIPFYILKFRTKLKIEDIMNLGLILPSFFMIYSWTRFLFIGSMAIAMMSGLGLSSFYDLLKTKITKVTTITLILLVVIPIISGAFSLHEVLVMRPPINKNWESALIYLRKHSNENDVVLAWWDYGAWIEYYARRGTVAQMGANQFVAKYLLGKVNENQLMAMGIDYVVVSYDTALKFGEILDTAKAEKKGHFLMILPLTSKIGALVFERGEYKILAKPGNTWGILVRSGNAVFSPKEAFLESKGNITKLELKGGKVADAYVYLNLDYDYAVLMTEKSFNTTLAKLMFTNEYPENYRLVYSDGGYIKIFKFTHPNVEIKKEKSTIRFEVANGDKEYTLCISGFYENGTRIFDECVPISKNNVILLELKISEVKVIRYTLREKKRILDAGVFRVT